MQETIEHYFKQRNTPSANSPTGLAMVELLKLMPGLSFEEVRAMVNEIGASTAFPKKVATWALVRNPAKAAA